METVEKVLKRIDELVENPDKSMSDLKELEILSDLYKTLVTTASYIESTKSISNFHDRIRYDSGVPLPKITAMESKDRCPPQFQY